MIPAKVYRRRDQEVEAILVQDALELAKHWHPLPWWLKDAISAGKIAIRHPYNEMKIMDRMDGGKGNHTLEANEYLVYVVDGQGIGDGKIVGMSADSFHRMYVCK